ASHKPLRGRLGQLVKPRQDDPRLAVRLGVAEVQVQAAALQRFGQLTCRVRCEEHNARGDRLHGSELANRDLEVAEQLEQKRLELELGAVDLVDEQYDRLLGSDRV